MSLHVLITNCVHFKLMPTVFKTTVKDFLFSLEYRDQTVLTFNNMFVLENVFQKYTFRCFLVFAKLCSCVLKCACTEDCLLYEVDTVCSYLLKFSPQNCKTAVS